MTHMPSKRLMQVTYPVNEVFDTIQGEATHTGTPATFLRLQGCAVGCPWCDTKHTWQVDPLLVVPAAMMALKTGDNADYALLTTAALVDGLAARTPRAVVITGGEPCIHDLGPLTAALVGVKALVQVETSGTQPIRVDPATWVTLSPKVGMPGGFVVRNDAVVRADEIKWPVGATRDIDSLLAFIGEHELSNVPIWLQPLSRSNKATQICIEAATRYGWRVSVQVHALLGVR